MLDDLARAARRAHAQDFKRKTVYEAPPGFDELPQIEQEAYRRIVRAVLVCFKEDASDAVIAAGFKQLCEEASIEAILAAMLEAAGR